MSTINICMTSYPRRIGNCAKVINSVLENTVLPDRIYLTLSHKEFPNWERDLPKDLYRLIMTSNRVILNWVEENTKSMKKVFPILQYLEDDDIIIDIDDDTILPKDFIESRLKDFHDNNDKHPITSNQQQSINLDNLIMSAFSLFQKKMLNGHERFVNPTVINTYNDDRTYLYLCHMNGYKLRPCTKYCVGKSFNRVVPLQIGSHGDYKYDIGPRYDNAVRLVVERLSGGKTIDQCFGLFKDTSAPEKKDTPTTKLTNMDWDKGYASRREGAKPTIDPMTAKIFQYNPDKPIKHDLVYVLGNGSKYNNMEIKISITSMLKFCSHWIGEIYVVGENPKIRNPKVHHIYIPDITKNNKDANIIHKLLEATKKIHKLTSNFLFCSDDILVTKKSDWEDFVPRYIFEYRQDEAFIKGLYNESKDNPWDTLLLKTLDRFIGYREHIYFYEPHIFAPINKKLFRKMCD